LNVETRGKTALYVLGLDIGTSSVRGLIYDARAMPVAGLGHHVTYSPTVSDDGGVTVDADMLINLIFQVLDGISLQASAADITIGAVGVSCFWHSLITLDGHGEPLTPVLLWADTRAGSVVRSISERIEASRVRRRTGAGLHASYWPARLVWLEQTQPKIYRQARHFVSLGELLHQRLFGTLRVSVSMASGTGLLNIARCEWDSYACSAASSIVERLSPLSDLPFTDLSPAFRNRWQALAFARWFPAIGDGACANLGAGGYRPDRFVVTVGTSSALRAVLPQACSSRRETVPLATRARALWNYRVDAASGIIGGALGEGGNLIAWLHANFKLPPLDEAERAIGGRAADSARITLLPFIAGERSPNWNAEARVVVSGIHLSTEPLDILQAALESVAYQLRAVYDALVSIHGAPEMVIASGAALARSPVWRRIIANVLERPLIASQAMESSSRGAAVFALDALGIIRPEDIDPLFGQTHEPVGSADAYRAARERQARLYRRVRADWI
jgi:gluconokinase